ncbi:MAG: ABC transporter permease subunit [Gammaproteobacteria bacterium]|nr:ABC transporter permease subunit [Gammaproteobacteria bacterium]
MNAIITLTKRELFHYFATPVATVFVVIFIALNALAAFQMAQLFEVGQATLTSFFNMQPWLYLFFIPALTMRLWAEERKSGSIELLLTLPISTAQAVIAKFLATWLFAGIALIGTMPLWLTINYLGDPDNGVILASYLGSWLMSAGFIAIGQCLSATTRNQVIAFVVSVVVCFVFVFIGAPALLEAFTQWLPTRAIDALSTLSFSGHFQNIARGVLDLRDVLFFIVMSTAWLLATWAVVERNKAE